MLAYHKRKKVQLNLMHDKAERKITAKSSGLLKRDYLYESKLSDYYLKKRLDIIF